MFLLPSLPPLSEFAFSSIHSVLPLTHTALCLNATPSMALLFDGLYSFQRSLGIGKLIVFISVHQFEEIFSALIDSAVDMRDKLSSEDYFSLCASGSSAEAQADAGIQTGASVDRAIVLLPHTGTLQVQKGTKTRGCMHKLHSSSLSMGSRDLSQQAHPINTSLPCSISTSFNGQVNSLYTEKNAYNRAVMDGCAMKPAQLLPPLWQQSLNMSKDLISMHKHQGNGIIPVPLFLHDREKELEFTDRLNDATLQQH